MGRLIDLYLVHIWVTPSPDIHAAIAAYGSLDRAIAGAVHDEAPILPALLAHRAGLIEQANPRAVIARLRTEAADLDRRAEPAFAEAAALFGKAAGRRWRGETPLAAAFEAQAEAAERHAVILEDEALVKRLEAARLEALLDLISIAA